jgi:hypothetical protein
MRTAAGRAGLVVVALALAVGAGCSGSGSGDGDGDGRSGSTTTSAPAPGSPSDASVVGTWTADGTDQLHALLSDQGLDEVPECTGRTDLELADDDTFTRTLAGTCGFADGDGEVELVTTGSYATADDALELTDVTVSGTITAGDQVLAIPTETPDGSSSVDYAIAGDELTITLPTGTATDPVAETFTRA